ncbi:MAG TPA: DUF3168 domain-containing protein [Sulfitobacter sp.]|uniref:tail completion protein gp17 n=1 Tax=Sulfitobacter dubius TaxID=218673 RepID=UPI000C3A2A4D|nr:hypothetical protein [Sulfitobacter sp.]HBB81917.1 DUF3168 domain-containing protein [Sulfitobacter sp.]
MEELLRAALLADAGVTGHAGDRVNYGAHPQGAPRPGVVLNTISDAGGHLIAAPEVTSQARVQVDCYADSYGAAKHLSRAVRQALNGYVAGAILGCFHAAARDGRDGGIYRVSLDFDVQYRTT